MATDLGLLKKDAEVLLRARGVFDVDHYGWLNLEEIDPEFVGYVMWVQNPPYDHDFMGWQDDIPPKRAPTAQEQRLMELGSDFFGLMKTSRHFVGQMLLYQPHVPWLRVEPTEFDFSEFAALVALTAAADRLRDFLITAVLGQKSEQKGELNASYDLLLDAGLDTEVAQLRTGFTAARKGREARHVAAHGLATQPAHVQRDLIGRDRAAYEAQSWGKPEGESYEAMIRSGKLQEDEEKAKINARTALVCETYIALVKLGEVVFRTEYMLRQRRDETGD
jgi:hypothetical protein